MSRASIHPAPWLRALRVACVLLVAAVPPTRAQQALVLGGGGARGLAHAGAIAGIEQRGWDPRLVVGTSIGAIVGSLYAAGYSADSLWTVTTEQDWREVFQFEPLAPVAGARSAYPLFRLGIGVDRSRYSDGLVSDFRVNRLLASALFDAATAADGDFDRLPRSFRAIASDFATGEAVVLGRGDLALAVRASMAVPGVFPPVLLGGRTLVDGGVADYLPVDVAKALGYTRVVGVDVVRPPIGTADMSPLPSLVRGSRLILMKAAPRTDADVLVVPPISADQMASLFPSDPTALLVLGREAALAQVPPVENGANEDAPVARPPARIVSVRAEAPTAALRELVERTFHPVLGAWNREAIFDAVDALYATGRFHGIWPRVVREDGSGEAELLVRADAVPPITFTGGVAYESDRRGRIWTMLRARPGGGVHEAGASFLLDEITTHADLRVRTPLPFRAAAAFVAEAHVTRADVRVFESERRTGDRGVRRAGGSLGLQWNRVEPDWTVGLRMIAEHVDSRQGERGAAWGPQLRIERVPELSRIAGEPALLEAEARMGAVGYRRVRARGSVDTSIGAGRLAVLADATLTSRDAPLDVQPALGDEHLVPGLRWGETRAPARLVGGVDIAWPLLLDIHVRARLRAGTAAATFDALDGARWRPGAELGLHWWTPLGVIQLGAGVARAGRPRLDIAAGSVF